MWLDKVLQMNTLSSTETIFLAQYPAIYGITQVGYSLVLECKKGDMTLGPLALRCRARISVFGGPIKDTLGTRSAKAFETKLLHFNGM